jgi:uncharacterized protein
LKFFITERTNVLAPVRPIAMQGGHGYPFSERYPDAASKYRRSAIIGGVDHADETAGSLLRRARVSSGLSQAELAVRAGVAQSVISAYEAGRRQPALPTLARLIDATGYDLVVDIQWQPPQLSRLSGPVGQLVKHKRRELVLAAAAHGVRNLRVFGSVARGEDRADSDVDLLADLPPGMGLLGLGRVRAELEAILGAKVDLIPASDLKPAVRARVEPELVAL